MYTFQYDIASYEKYAPPCSISKPTLQSRNSLLKEYSVILITSFYDINQQILRKKGYFQNFS